VGGGAGFGFFHGAGCWVREVCPTGWRVVEVFFVRAGFRSEAEG
jgi:hypothetical protein